MNSLEEILIAHQHKFQKVVPFNSEIDSIVQMDFTANNTDLTEEMISDTSIFSTYITTYLNQKKALYGIGGYNELRTLYSRSNVFTNADEPRRLHLGIDIWGKATTPVFAALEGKVHSFANNNAFGDYGATILLKHTLGGITFFTLYGHLSLSDINELYVGNRVNEGECFAHFGEAEENGNWPPHLHFQIIKNMEDYKGDYPGVCKFSEREKYLANCPNPDFILNLMNKVKL